MPVYDFHCPTCRQTQSLYRKLTERDALALCQECTVPLKRQTVYRSFVAADYPAYVSPASGRLIEGKRAHLEDLKRTGCRIYEPGETEAFIRRKKEREEAFDRAVEQVVEQAATEISS